MRGCADDRSTSDLTLLIFFALFAAIPFFAILAFFRGYSGLVLASWRFSANYQLTFI
jgi:hypothetical protein